MLSTLPTGLYRAVLAAAYDPKGGTEPPGNAATGMHTIMDWAAGIGLAICVVSAIGAGVMLAMSYFGHGSPKLGAIGWVCAAVALVSSAAPIVNTIAGA
jgi:hypothetical protein